MPSCGTNTINIGSDNITLDCEGYHINSGGGSGVFIKEKINVTIKNCNISGGSFGIYLEMGSNHTIIDNILSDHGIGGIGVYRSDYNLIKNNIALYNDDCGIQIFQGSDFNFVINNTANNSNRFGMLLDSSSRNNITNNIFGDNNQDGIYFQGASSNYLTKNKFEGNNLRGIYLYSGSGNIIWDNIFLNSPTNVEEGANGNNWTLMDIGNHWDDFDPNIGYPYYYEIFGGGNGIDTHPYGAYEHSCGDVITDNAYLTVDLLNCPGNGIVIDASNIILNCFGNTISVSKHGILLNGVTNVSITNCHLTNSDYGVYLNNSQNNIIWNNGFDSNTVNAYEDANSINNKWNLSSTGNYWDDFEDNLGHPHDYYIHGDGNGIDYYPVVPIYNCGDWLTKDTKLYNHLLNCPENGLNIGTENITLDCNCFMINYSGHSVRSGINIDHTSGVTVKNCNISSYYSAIYLWSSHNNTIINNNLRKNRRSLFSQSANYNKIINNLADNNTNRGIFIYRGSNNNYVFNNSASYNVNYGIYLQDNCDNNEIVHNTANNNSYGIYAYDALNTTYIDNNVHNNSQSGIFFWRESNNHLEGNNASNNQYGIFVRASNNNFTNNILEDNDYGIYSEYGNSKYTDNKFIDNRLYGIYLTGSNGNYFWDNSFDNLGTNAYEESCTSYWNLSYIGNMWSDIGSNPGYPNYYEIPGPGAGIDYQPFSHGCGDTINEDLILTFDLINCPSDGLIVGSDNITIDCNNRIIQGSGTGSGIYSAGRNGLTVKNCNIMGFANGINLLANSYGGIIDNVISNNQNGIILSASNLNNISTNSIRDNSNGVYLENSINNDLSMLTVYNNTIGIKLERSDDNFILLNDFLNNTNYGAFSNNSQDNIFWRNRFISNGINAYEENNINYWNLSITGNYWADFESNIGYPNFYEISGMGDGIDWHPNDQDGDDVLNSVDNCIDTPNANQSDIDNDLIGDACDNCVNDYNPNQYDIDKDGLGDVCDPIEEINVLLESGWNFVTLPRDNGTSYDSSTFSDLLGADTIVRYDGERQKYFGYVRGTNFSIFDISYGQGFLVHVTENKNITVNGSYITSVQVNVFAGWNMLGWPHPAPTTAEDFGHLLEHPKIIAKLVSQNWINYSYGSMIGNFDINVGEGVLIYVNQSQVWNMNIE